MRDRHRLKDPIPVIGPILAAILFGCVGVLVGAMIGEGWKGRGLRVSWQVEYLVR